MRLEREIVTKTWDGDATLCRNHPPCDSFSYVHGKNIRDSTYVAASFHKRASYLRHSSPLFRKEIYREESHWFADVTALWITLVTSAEQGPIYSPFHPVHPWHRSCAPGTCTVCRAAPRSPGIARFRACARRPSPARCKPCAANQECADRWTWFPPCIRLKASATVN